MDFIERFFGFSPDGGDGSTEIAWISTILVIIAVVVVARYMKRGGGSTKGQA